MPRASAADGHVSAGENEAPSSDRRPDLIARDAIPVTWCGPTRSLTPLPPSAVSLGELTAVL
jgi:hypothetical protein